MHRKTKPSFQMVIKFNTINLFPLSLILILKMNYSNNIFGDEDDVHILVLCCAVVLVVVVVVAAVEVASTVDPSLFAAVAVDVAIAIALALASAPCRRRITVSRMS